MRHHRYFAAMRAMHILPLVFLGSTVNNGEHRLSPGWDHSIPVPYLLSLVQYNPLSCADYSNVINSEQDTHMPARLSQRSGSMQRSLSEFACYDFRDAHGISGSSSESASSAAPLPFAGAFVLFRRFGKSPHRV